MRLGPETISLTAGTYLTLLLLLEGTVFAYAFAYAINESCFYLSCYLSVTDVIVSEISENSTAVIRAELNGPYAYVYNTNSYKKKVSLLKVAYL